MKINKLKILILIVCSVLTLGLICVEQESVYAVSSSKDCYYLIDQNNNPYLSNVKAGTAEGYGEIKLNFPTTISAHANDPFVIVGWYVTFDEQGSNSELYDLATENIVYSYGEGDDQVDVTLNIVASGDGKTSELYISNVFEHLTVEPVFDYIYYNVDITQFGDYIDLTQTIKIDDGIDAYYSSASVPVIDGDTTIVDYYDVYIQNGYKKFYYGTLREKTELGVKTYYSLHNKAVSGEVVEEIPYSYGAFRLGDEVDISYDVGVSGSNFDNNNIDITGFSVLASSGNKSLIADNTSNMYSVEKDEYKRSVSYETKFNIVQDMNFVNRLIMDYDLLYKFDFNITLDNSPVGSYTVKHYQNASVGGYNYANLYERDGEFYRLVGDKKRFVNIEDASSITYASVEADLINEYENILNLFTFNNAYHQIDGDTFLVKNKEDNKNVAFQLYVPETISDEFDDNEYTYYVLDSSIKSMMTFENLVTNGTININYNSKQYYVDFKFALKYGSNSLDVSSTEFVMPNRLELTRGDVATFNVDGTINFGSNNLEVPEILGYNFVGYAFGNGEIKNSGSYKINYLNPTSLSTVSNNPVYLCYEKVEYTITLCNYNQIHLGTVENPVYPINNIVLNYNINGISSNGTITQANLNNSTYTIAKTFTIYDSVSFAVNANNGLSVDGLTVDFGSTDYINSITFDEDFLSGVEGSNVNLYVVESFIYYTVEYSTSTVVDTNSNKIAQSNIDISIPDYATVIKYDAEDNIILDGDLSSVVVKFEISNLKYGDDITLNSTPAMVGELYYNFVMFTEDHKVGLNYNVVGSVNPYTYSHNETISSNKSLFVVYSSPTTQLNILFSKLNAYDFGSDYEHNVVVMQNGERIYNQNSDGSMSYNIVAGSEISVRLNEEKINKGYALISYALTVAGNTTNGTNSMQFEFIAENGVHTLTFNFDVITYHMYFAQHGAGYDGEYIQNETNDYFVLDVENLSLQFNKPEGYYISSAVANSGDESQNIAGLIGGNDDRNLDDIISLTYEFDVEEFIDLVEGFAVKNNDVYDLVIDIEYSTYLYQMLVGYRLTNPKNDYRDSNVTFPNITLTYTFADVQITKNYDARSENNLTFVGIPYGSTNVTLQVVSNVSNGLEIAGWTYSNNYYIGTDFVNTDDYLVVPEVKQDYGFLYKLSYAAYNLKLNYNKVMGSPIVYVNDVKITDLNNVQIAQFDKLRIEANVSRTKGYRFVSLSYETNNQNEIETVETFESIYQVEAFDVSNYIVKSSGIDFDINYDLLYMKVVNSAQDSVNSNLTLHGAGRGDAKIDIPLNEYASYKVYATNVKTDERREITSLDSVTINDIIELYVTINNAAHNVATDANGNLLDETVYDLTKGLKLTNVNISGVAYSFVELGIGSGTYYATFGLSDKVDSETYLIDNVAESNDIDIRYSYSVQTKNITVTTNINDDSFYENRKFNSYIDQSIYGFGSGQQQQDGKFTSSSLQFLAKSRIGYFLNEYENYFKITSLKVKSNGVNINQNEYDKYGIVIYTRKIITDADGNPHAELVVREDPNDVISALEIRYIENIDIVLELQPILYFAGKEAELGTTVFAKTYAFACDNNGRAKYQQISVGTNYLTYDIASDSIILSNMNITYKNSKGVVVGAYKYNGTSWGGMTDVGEYKISITFDNSGTYQWLSQLSLPNEIIVNVVQRNVYLVVDDNLEVVEDEYDGLETTNRYDILKYLYIQDGMGLNISYLTSASNNGFSILTGLNGYRVEHTKEVDGVQIPYSQASDVLYNLYVTNLTLDPNNLFNSNFKLMNESVVFNSCFKINKRLIFINGITVYDKIYDGTRNGLVNPNSTITLYNTIVGDNVVVNIADIVATFDSINVGKNKTVLLDLSKALSYESAVNYYFNNITVNNATVYPSQLTTKVEGYGNVSIYNVAGLTDPTKVNLIPVGAQLDVKVVKSDTQDYARIFSYINQYLTNTNVFAVGFELRLSVEGSYVTLSNELHLSVPKIKELTGVINLFNEDSARVQYVVEDENVIIDLNSVDESIGMIILTQKRSFFQLWQIILIVAGGTVVVAGVVVTFVVIRRNRKKRFDINDTI